MHSYTAKEFVENMRHILPQILVKSQPLLLLYFGNKDNNIQQRMAIYNKNFINEFGCLIIS